MFRRAYRLLGAVSVGHVPLCRLVTSASDPETHVCTQACTSTGPRGPRQPTACHPVGRAVGWARCRLVTCLGSRNPWPARMHAHRRDRVGHVSCLPPAHRRTVRQLGQLGGISPSGSGLAPVCREMARFSQVFTPKMAGLSQVATNRKKKTLLGCKVCMYSVAI